MFAVKIHREKPAPLVAQHRINAHDKRKPASIRAGEMPANDFLRNRQPRLIRTTSALDARLFAHPAHPLISTRWRVARASRFPTFKPRRIHILTPTKQRAKERDFLGGR